MLIKADIKLVRSLEQRRVRRSEGLFVAEGPRLVGELLGHFECYKLFATDEWLKAHPSAAARNVVPVDEREMSRLSLMQTPNQVLALFVIPEDNAPAEPEGLNLVLDNVQDPGNLGTIVRLADWFGVEHIWCSPTTVDIWSPKVVQATMGGLARVRVHYLELVPFLEKQQERMPIYGTSLAGDSLWSQELTENALVVMGNEGNGVSHEVEALCQRKLFIPNYPPTRATTESLNVAMATGIILAEFRRRMF